MSVYNINNIQYTIYLRESVLCILSYSIVSYNTDILMNISVCYKLIYVANANACIHNVQLRRERVSILRVRSWQE